MSLIIKKSNNVYELKGSLVKFNIPLFEKIFQDFFVINSDLRINIINLERIDSFGLNAIAKLNNDAISFQKTFSIIGMGNKELFNLFKV
ncbi:hypothetical protein NA63_0276 [Flavobacteriaceae bacterium MAR_2010_105]|nr:hypothetical protein NA63_0276 [Flavobacteriaceae bacterium MAR_2010_105]